MLDCIKGTVTNVVDGDTFDMTVTSQDPNNEYQYGDNERIRIAGTNAQETGTKDGGKAMLLLAYAILNKNVKCSIHSCDVYQRLVASYTVIN